jgi:lipopolysaccharide/colanic/teichoic acid biosynthesis glycosyltransferase
MSSRASSHSAALSANRSSMALKRAFDLIGVLIGLVAVFPLMLVIAAAVKLDTRGPVFFRQRRVGSYSGQRAHP